MPKIEQLFAEIRAMNPEEIEAKIAAHQAEIKALRRLMLMVNKTEPEVEIVSDSPHGM